MQWNAQLKSRSSTAPMNFGNKLASQMPGMMSSIIRRNKNCRTPINLPHYAPRQSLAASQRNCRSCHAFARLHTDWRPRWSQTRPSHCELICMCRSFILAEGSMRFRSLLFGPVAFGRRASLAQSQGLSRLPPSVYSACDWARLAHARPSGRSSRRSPGNLVTGSLMPPISNHIGRGRSFATERTMTLCPRT